MVEVCCVLYRSVSEQFRLLTPSGRTPVAGGVRPEGVEGGHVVLILKVGLSKATRAGYLFAGVAACFCWRLAL